RVAGDPALHGHQELGRRGRRDADAVADHAAIGHRLGARLPAPVPAADAVQRLAGTAARADRLGPGGPGRLGQRAVRRPRTRLGLYALFEKRRRGRLKTDLKSLTMSFMEASSAVRARSVP